MNQELEHQLRLCRRFAAVPLIIGYVILFLIWLFDWAWLYAAGLLTMLALGALMYLASFHALVWTVHTARTRTDPAEPVFGPFARLIGFYIFLGIMAMGAVRAAAACAGRYELIVHNDSDQPMEHVRATCNWVGAWFWTIDPGQTKRRLFWFPGHGPVGLRGTHMGKDFATVIDSEGSCGGWRETTRVTLGRDGVLRSRNWCDEFTEETDVPIHPPAASSPPVR